MADDRHYVGGDWYRVCDRTGFKVRANKTRMEWTGRIVRDSSWEPRQPQDLVLGVEDDQSVSQPRPRQLDQFQGPLGSTLTADVAAGGYLIPIMTSKRMFIGDQVGVMLANGVTFRTFIEDVPTTTSIQVLPVLPYSATSGSVLINYSALSNPVLYE